MRKFLRVLNECVVDVHTEPQETAHETHSSGEEFESTAGTKSGIKTAMTKHQTQTVNHEVTSLDHTSHNSQSKQSWLP